MNAKLQIFSTHKKSVLRSNVPITQLVLLVNAINRTSLSCRLQQPGLKYKLSPDKLAFYISLRFNFLPELALHCGIGQCSTRD